MDTPHRGAPPGNTNALKHGFYSKAIRPTDQLDLLTARPYDLRDEIDLLRLYIRRTVEQGGAEKSLPEAIDLLRVLCLASRSLTSLLRAESVLRPSRMAIDKALAELDAFTKSSVLSLPALRALAGLPPAAPPLDPHAQHDQQGFAGRDDEQHPPHGGPAPAPRQPSLPFPPSAAGPSSHRGGN